MEIPTKKVPVKSEIYPLPPRIMVVVKNGMSPRRLTFQIEPFSTEMMTTGERIKKRKIGLALKRWCIEYRCFLVSHIVIEYICALIFRDSIKLQVFKNGFHWDTLHMAS